MARPQHVFQISQPGHLFVLLAGLQGVVAAASLRCPWPDPAKGLAQLLEWPKCLGFRVGKGQLGLGLGEGVMAELGIFPLRVPTYPAASETVQG